MKQVKTQYCLGFLIQDDFVVLIRKTHPPWQAGRLNGVGGHIEKNEQPADAMSREFEEETGVTAPIDSWNVFAVMSGNDWECHCFWAYGDVFSCKSKTDEEVEQIHRGSIALRNDTIENLPWLLAMIESQKIDHVSFYEIGYNKT